MATSNSEKLSASPAPSEDTEEEVPLLKLSPADLTARRNRAQSTQAIAHRGYKSQYPENTMVAFAGAVSAGAHAIETDLHLTRDGVVVISHDATLKRCFGVDKKIIDCDWDEVRQLRTLREPREHMPQLKEVLEFMLTPEARGTWLLLDIKIDTPPEKLMRLTAETIADVHEEAGRAEFWGGRIVLGCWTLKYLPLCEKYLPGFPIVHIGFSIPYAQQFLEHKNVGFNIFWPILQTATGKAFMQELHDAGRKVFVWNINDEAGMKWAIQNECIDGVCTDDPVKFKKLCESYTKDWIQVPPTSFTGWAHVVVWNVVAVCFSVYFRWKLGKEHQALASKVTP